MAGRARLHWFWRGAIALVVGAIGVLCVISVAMMLGGNPGAMFFLLTPLPGIVVYGLLTRDFGPPPPDGECYCRRCHHILRGLSEPRCPECGEAI